MEPLSSPQAIIDFCLAPLALDTGSEAEREVRRRKPKRRSPQWLHGPLYVVIRGMLSALCTGDVEQNLRTARALAEAVADQKEFVFVADGPNYATALFSAAKLIEAAGRHAMGQETEEWAHLQYFVNVDVKTPTFIISPGGRGHGRAAELVEPMKRIGRMMAAVACLSFTYFSTIEEIAFLSYGVRVSSRASVAATWESCLSGVSAP